MVGQHWCKAIFFQNLPLNLKQLLKSCWPSGTKVNFGGLSVEKKLIGLPQIVKAVYKAWPNLRVKVRTCIVFPREPCYEKGVMPNVNSVLCSNSKDELRDLHDFLNQKVITSINSGR